MKKLIALVLAMVCVLGMVGCTRTPAQPGNVEGNQTEEVDLVPMVMVNGVLYFDTGYVNSELRKCGTPDGEITSQVKRSQEPTENNQSNFGTGYGYQYGKSEGTIEIYMNEKWCIFATEEARK